MTIAFPAIWLVEISRPKTNSPLLQVGTITFSKWLLVLLWYRARNSVNYRGFYINKHQRGRKKLVYKVLKVKYVKMIVFVRKKLAFVEPAKRRFMNCFCVQKINQNKHNFLLKSLTPMDNFAKHLSGGFVFNFLLF